ncbi:MAG: tryptophan synthase subunit alpha [Capnocytophaga sp.]|nr:tryptophan synthase subunit alpha [Capnocytophaga sp.]
MKRITTLFEQNKKVFSVYFTAGYPQLDDTVPIIEALQQSGVDMIEIGIPFSDPLADGPTIQRSSKTALDNGMTLELLFKQLKNIREKVDIPLLLMGYFNPVMQYGVERFCKECAEVGIDGVIIPDLPLDEYVTDCAPVFGRYGLTNIFLITPQTSDKRIRKIDRLSDGFIYMVSSAGVTGAKDTFGQEQQAYFKRVAALGLNNPTVIGFGISNKETFRQATKYSQGAIVGSAFIKFISENAVNEVDSFVDGIVG